MTMAQFRQEQLLQLTKILIEELLSAPTQELAKRILLSKKPTSSMPSESRSNTTITCYAMPCYA